MKNFLWLFAGAVCVSGCAATFTPSGDIYTELLVPSSTVIVEEHPAPPVIVSAPRPVVVSRPRPWGPISSRPHGKPGITPRNRPEIGRHSHKPHVGSPKPSNGGKPGHHPTGHANKPGGGQPGGKSFRPR